MRLGILLCDDVKQELQLTHRNYPDMFTDILHRAEPSLALTFYRVMDFEYPASIDENDGYIISGSRYSVYDDLPWIKQFEAFVRELYENHIPTVGICFGHQMMAQALGGEVTRSNKGWGVGIATSELTQPAAWLSNEKKSFSLVVSHQDQVSQLPRDSQTYASSEFCPIGMYTVGQHFLAIQGHPEFSRAYSFDLMEARRDRIPEPVIDAGQDSLKQNSDSDDVTRWMLAFLEQARRNA
ncbi:gamma-glutamyl-gamma-aminobutyrate hydrolase family protein [Enterovibrio sp. ZSDZ35]|uniref:Gamma-glutamyl-gamma-aminobutyrate hydrolase family protein n=1 Tax=Enterovibrio qingdaonensis TaxID=2899818 RepID=A0ABT5QIS5_9GAMM|nr:gamma-glutamyl-gamma-aminobutyrate hydrolase family protein [Enterovibrio sp. ZSDZ35]MDD1780892.1 gamma-glutamyl-gamma-aminobutyrate hydrolase family protein [Enterovibrio sp. ZSDZ35]